MSRTIQCGSCGARMRLSAPIIERIAGKTGKITCKVCDGRLCLDFRGEQLVVTMAGEGRPSAAAMLSRPTAPRASEDGPHVPPTIEVHGNALESVRPRGSSLPPPLPMSTHDESVPSLLELARQSRGPSPDDGQALPLTSRREALPLLNRRAALPLVRRSSYPPAHDTVASENDDARSTSGSLSPHVLDDSALTHVGSTDDSSPYSASLRDAEVDRLYAHTRPPSRQSARTLSASRPPARSLGPKKVSLPPPPPRPWELEAMPAKETQAPGPFERFGLASAPPMPSAVLLTPDGRLVNASDRPVQTSQRRLGRSVVLPFLAVVGVALGAAAARPEIRGLLGGRAVVAREIDLEHAGVAAVAPPLPSAAATPAVEVDAGELGSLESSQATLVVEPTMIAASGPAVPAATTNTKAKTSSKSQSAETKSQSAETTISEAPAAEAERGPFDATSANISLNEATAHASGCRKEGDPSGIARVVITFAPSGRATSATISGPPFTGTDTGSCIAARFRGASVPPFSGDHVTVAKTVTIQ